MQIFHRQTYSELVITLQADASLGLLTSGFVEDYFGVDNQLSLYNVLDNTRTPILIEEDVDATPDTPHDVFVAVIDLSTIADGVYQLQGRARDSVGNYTILTDFQSPQGTEQVALYEFLVAPLGIVVFSPKEAQVILVEKPDSTISLIDKPDASLWLPIEELGLFLRLKDCPDAAIDYMDNKLDLTLASLETPELQILDMYTV